MSDDRKDPPDHLDPVTVQQVAMCAARWLRWRMFSPDAPDAPQVLDDLDMLARDARELVQRREHEGRPWPGMGSLTPQRPIPVPLWWRDEYRDDPLLAALAQYGVPAGRALAAVIDAYRSLRGVLVSIELRRPPDPARWVVPAPTGWSDAEIVAAVRTAGAVDLEQSGEENFAGRLFLGLARKATWTPARVHALWVALGRPALAEEFKDATGIEAVERARRQAGGSPT